jgi:uncharacterized coiled-coil DUF342 family protein
MKTEHILKSVKDLSQEALNQKIDSKAYALMAKIDQLNTQIEYCQNQLLESNIKSDMANNGVSQLQQETSALQEKLNQVQSLAVGADNNAGGCKAGHNASSKSGGNGHGKSGGRSR